MSKITSERLRSCDEFTRAYLEALLWSSTDDEGKPLDYDYSLLDFSDEAFQTCVEDCRFFQDTNAELLSQWSELGPSDTQAGHDFALTRNRHGAGFWDRGYNHAIEFKLTESSYSFGGADLYAGDDGLLYIM